MATDVDRIPLIGGDLALDFANLRNGPRDGPPDTEYLEDGGDLATWGRRSGALPETLADRLDAAPALHRARELRDAVYAVFRAVAEGSEAPRDALAAIQAEYRDALAHARLERDGARFDWRWPDEPDPARILWPVAAAAVDLLRSERLGRVKVCTSCRWLFLDSSKNRSRRWCRMEGCGGRAKMRRYRARRG